MRLSARKIKWARRVSKWMARTIIVTVGAGGVVALVLAPVGVGKHGDSLWPLGQWGRHHLFANMFVIIGYIAVVAALVCLAFLAIRGLFRLAEWDQLKGDNMVVITPEPAIPDELETISEDDEIILKAENYILEHGWHQGGFQGPDGSVCILGALHAAIGKPLGPFSYEEKQMLRSLVFRRFGYQSDLANFNDTPGRTKEDVLNLLRKARSRG